MRLLKSRWRGLVMGCEWPLTELGKAFGVVPQRKLTKGKEAPFVAMDRLPTNSRSIKDYETRVFKGSGSRFRNGDTLLARITPCLENGKTAYVRHLPENIAAHGSTEFIVISGIDGVSDNLFAYYVARSPHFRAYAISHMEGTSGRQRVPATSIKKYRLALPSLAEQQCIAAVLGALDDKIELNRKMNKTLEAMAQAIFKSWFVDFELFRDGGMVDSELGPIPKGWKVGNLGELARVSTGKRQKSRVSEKDSDHQVPLVGGAGQIAWTKDALFTQPLITTGRVGTLGVVLLWNKPIWPSDNALVVSADDSCGIEFLYHHMMRKDLVNLNRGSTQPMLTQKDIKNIRFAIPQLELLQHFADMVGHWRKRLEFNLTESNTLANLRDTLLPKLISGEIRVPDAGKFANEVAK